VSKKAYLPINQLGVLFIFILCSSIWLTACTQLDVFEKSKPIPNNQWQYSFQPAFDFLIKDTTARYNVFIVLRHTDAYRYNNIWLNVGTQSPKDSIRYQKFELQLGTDAQGWEGTGMDNIWELRKLITNGPVKFNKAGNYHFAVAQIMRENPLPNIMDVGIRVEKVR
jgi:gliding motility-associated lipoprotein GldH